MSSFIHLTIFQQDVNFIGAHILGDMSNFIPLTSFYEELKISILMKPLFLEICPVVFFLQVVFKKPILIEPFLWGYVQFHLHICQFWSSLNCSQSLFYFVPQEKEFHSQTFIHLTSQPLPSLHFNGRFNFYISYIYDIFILYPEIVRFFASFAQPIRQQSLWTCEIAPSIVLHMV